MSGPLTTALPSQRSLNQSPPPAPRQRPPVTALSPPPASLRAAYDHLHASPTVRNRAPRRNCNGHPPTNSHRQTPTAIPRIPVPKWRTRRTRNSEPQTTTLNDDAECQTPNRKRGGARAGRMAQRTQKQPRKRRITPGRRCATCKRREHYLSYARPALALAGLR